MALLKVMKSGLFVLTSRGLSLGINDTEKAMSQMGVCECASGFEIPLRGVKFYLDKEASRSMVTEIVGQIAGQGLPIFSLIWSFASTEPGFLNLSEDHGLLTRETFPSAWTKLEQMMAAGSPTVIDDTAWLAERAANGGVCGKFSSGDGMSTFRVPLIAGMECASVAAGHTVGAYQPDQMRPINNSRLGVFAGNPVVGLLRDMSGAFYGSGSATLGPQYGGAVSNVSSYANLDTSRLGVNFNGADTHSKRIFVAPLLKISG